MAIAVEKREEIFVELLEEGVEVFRPVEAILQAGGAYRIISEKTDPDEVWRFPPGSLVRCQRWRFSGGSVGLLAVEAAPEGEQ